MARILKFDTMMIRKGSNSIITSTSNVRNAIDSVNRARNNEHWGCPEKSRITSNLETTRDLMKEFNKRTEKFAAACSTAADAFDYAEKKFIETQKNIVDRYRAPSAKKITIISAAINALVGIIAKVWGFFKIKPENTEPVVGKNPFSDILCPVDETAGQKIDSIDRIEAFDPSMATKAELNEFRALILGLSDGSDMFEGKLDAIYVRLEYLTKQSYKLDDRGGLEISDEVNKGDFFIVPNAFNSAYYYKQTSNKNCAATAEMIAYDIYHNFPLKKINQNNDGGALWYDSTRYTGPSSDDKYECNTEVTWEQQLAYAYENIGKGIPTITRIKGTPGNLHSVVAIGISPFAKPDKLTIKDFIFVDPADGVAKQLTPDRIPNEKPVSANELRIPK